MNFFDITCLNSRYWLSDIIQSVLWGLVITSKINLVLRLRKIDKRAGPNLVEGPILGDLPLLSRGDLIMALAYSSTRKNSGSQVWGKDGAYSYLGACRPLQSRHCHSIIWSRW